MAYSRHSREYIIEQVNAALANPATLYTKNFINYKSVDEYRLRCTEIVAQEIARRVKNDNFDAILSIPPINREKSYKTEGHAELAKRTQPDNPRRKEEWIAIGMYGKSFKRIGKVLDFQIPLKNTRSDLAGKIDHITKPKTQHTYWS